MISLVKDTIDKQDINDLISWLNENPRLTKGEKTIEFEKIWSEYTGVKYSVYVNSGSSANLAMAYALQVSGHLRNKVVLAPAVSWVTTVSPFIQLGYNVKLFDCDKDTLGPDIEDLKRLIKKHKPSVMIFVHVLGFPSKMKEIQELCKKYDVVLLEDSCESIGSTYDNKKTGSFGLMSSFSFYFGHHLSVSPYTQIPYLDENNIFNIDNIESIYNEYNMNINKIKILSFDKDYNTIYNQPYNIIKHKIENKKILRLKLFTNRQVDITEDHCVFSYDKNDFKIIEKKGNEIKKGDYILVPSKLPHPELLNELNFIDFCKKTKDKFFVINYDIQDVNNLKFKWDSKENRQKDNWKKRKVLPLEFLKKETTDLKIALKNTPKSKYISTKYKITNDLCRLIGYFIAEGSYGDGGLNFSFNTNEIEYINDVKNIIKNIFNLDVFNSIIEEKNSCTIQIYSTTLRIFFEEFLNIKIGASNKRIPNFIYHSSESCKISFLYGYFCGDGSQTDTRINVTSVSKNLISDISYLFNMLGLNGSIQESFQKERSVKKIKIKKLKIQYSFTLNHVQLFDGHLEIDKKTEFSHPHKRLTFPISHNRDYKCVDYIKNFKNDNLNDFINSDLMLLKVIELNEIIPEYEYVYDFCVNNLENFIGGNQPICLHNSTIEGGMICTDDFNMYNILKAIRSHGWDRDLDEPFKSELKRDYGVDDFKDLYTFYFPGFNLRSTDLQAYIGMLQMDKIDNVVSTRNENYKLYHENIKNDYWKIKPTENSFVSNFAYPIITPKIDKLVKVLKDNYIETRPLICGSIANQPFWTDRYPTHEYKMADDVDKLGLYLPNNHNLTKEEILFVCKIVNGVLNS
jgi:dTDP-4-amino-4,6-dideoxygalactose transaminase/intein/homing endonuclease